MEERVELIGKIKEIAYRERSPEGFYRRCAFILTNNIVVLCEGFIPIMRLGWKVKVVGDWSEGEEKILLAKEVERYDERKEFASKDTQTKLIGDNKNE